MLIRSACTALALGMLLLAGCEKKKDDAQPAPAESSLPKAVPGPLQEPHQILAYLQYLGTQKNMKPLTWLYPKEENASLGAAKWFNEHSGDCGLALTEDEIKTFGLMEVRQKGFIATLARTELQKKLDEIEVANSEAPQKGKRKPSVKIPPELAGLKVSRLDFPRDMDKKTWDTEAKVLLEKFKEPLFEAGLWRLIKGVPEELWSEIQVLGTQDNPDPKVKNVNLGLQGKLVIELGLFRRPDQTYGLCYWHYKVSPKTLKKAVEKRKSAAGG